MSVFRAIAKTLRRAAAGQCHTNVDVAYFSTPWCSLHSAARALLKLLDQTGCLSFSQVIGDLAPRLLAQCLQVTSLWACHRLVAGDPVRRIFLGCFIRRLLRVVAHMRSP